MKIMRGWRKSVRLSSVFVTYMTASLAKKSLRKIFWICWQWSARRRKNWKTTWTSTKSMTRRKNDIGNINYRHYNITQIWEWAWVWAGIAIKIVWASVCCGLLHPVAALQSRWSCRRCLLFWRGICTAFRTHLTHSALILEKDHLVYYDIVHVNLKFDSLLN
jgi:hypothetical protein